MLTAHANFFIFGGDLINWRQMKKSELWCRKEQSNIELGTCSLVDFHFLKVLRGISTAGSIY